MRLPRVFVSLGRGGGASPILVTLMACIITLQVIIVTREDCGEAGELTTGHVVSRRAIKEVQQQQQQDVVTERAIREVRVDWTPDTQLCECDDMPNLAKALRFPVPSRDKGFLTIGIPTIQRKGDSYLVKTIKSLVSSMSTDDRKQVIIVVFLADTDPAIKNQLSSNIRSNFSDIIDTGLLHVIEAPLDYYPEIKITKFTYGQPEEYIRWRAKQNFDYSFMMKYSLNLSNYYMQIEDDVITLPGYISAIHQYISEQPDQSWTCLEFSELGFIGKLYKSTDVFKLASMLTLFYEEQPVDYTYLYFNMMNTQMVQRLKKPTLFQHQGIHSSYPGKIQPLKDRFFDNMTKIYQSDNPAAEVYTSMKVFLTFQPRLAYEKTEGYFWTHGSPSDGDSFTVVFQEPQSLRRVVVDTGSAGHPEDHLQNGVLEVSLTLLKTDNSVQCINDIVIGDFKEGRVDEDNLKEKIKFQVMCLRIKVTKHQEPWLIVREIAVFTS